MTKADPAALRSAAAALCLALAALAAGCAGGGTGKSPGSADPFAEPRSRRESADIVREDSVGPVIVSYASAPLARNAPPDGVRAAVLRAIGDERLSAACFHWEEREAALRWIREQMDVRRRDGRPARVILAGHGLGATEASETARELLFRERDFEITLLLTVDAVKSSRYGGAAYAAGNAIVNRLPGVSHSFTAYDAAPVPDGRQVRAHINYYQNKSTTLHGAAMPGAENHLLADWTGVLNHGNADDFAMPNLIADLKYAVARGRGGRRP